MPLKGISLRTSTTQNKLIHFLPSACNLQRCQKHQPKRTVHVAATPFYNTFSTKGVFGSSKKVSICEGGVLGSCCLLSRALSGATLSFRFTTPSAKGTDSATTHARRSTCTHAQTDAQPRAQQGARTSLRGVARGTHSPSAASAAPLTFTCIGTLGGQSSVGWLRATPQRLCSSFSSSSSSSSSHHHLGTTSGLGGVVDMEAIASPSSHPPPPSDPDIKSFDAPSVAHDQSVHNEYLGFFFRTVEWRPHPRKAAAGGEDSYMATDYALGVADGVGWWDQLEEGDKELVATTSPSVSASGSAAAHNNKNISKVTSAPLTPKTEELKRSAAQQYSETFMRAAFEFCEDDYLGQGEVPVDRLAEFAYEHSKHVKMGSCTVVFATVVNNHLQVYSLGDCTLLLIRCGKVIFRSEEKTHGLNFPYQLGVGSKDRPADGAVATIKIRRGDVIVMGSDGIFDNVFEEDIINTLKKHDGQNLSDRMRLLGLVDSEQMYDHIINNERRSASARALAGTHAQEVLKIAGKEIIDMAVSNTNDPRANTPFAMKCIESGAYHEGGKMDDMTLVMATVASSLMSEGVRFGTSDFGEVPPPYKNWPASTQYIESH